MECIKILVFSLFLVGSINAQVDSTDYIYNETGIGFNFINNFLPNDSDIGGEAPFQFYFNSWNHENVRRIGLGFDIGGDVFREDDGRKISTSRFGIDLSLGGGKSRSISDKLNFIGGGDYLIGANYSTLSVSDDDNGNTDNSRNTFAIEMGGGIFAGLQYHFTSRLSLYTQMTYYFVLDYSVTNLKFDSLSRDDQKETEYGYGTRFSPPSYLVLFYRF